MKLRTPTGRFVRDVGDHTLDAVPEGYRGELAHAPRQVARQLEDRRRYGPSPKEWEDAINRRDLGQEVAEQQAGIFPLEDEEEASIQATEGEGEYVLRVGIGDENTLRELVSVYAWVVELTYQEGYRGSKFVEPISVQISQPIFVPVKGIAIALHGDNLFATIRNLSGAARTLSFALIKRPIRESYRNVLAGGLTEIPDFSVDFSVDVENGAQSGDTIELYDYAGNLLVSFPASDIGVWSVWQDAAYVNYNPAGSPVQTTFKFRVCR